MIFLKKLLTTLCYFAVLAVSAQRSYDSTLIHGKWCLYSMTVIGGVELNIDSPARTLNSVWEAKRKNDTEFQFTDSARLSALIYHMSARKYIGTLAFRTDSTYTIIINQIDGATDTISGSYLIKGNAIDMISSNKMENDHFTIKKLDATELNLGFSDEYHPVGALRLRRL
jgi:hypothetical protein